MEATRPSEGFRQARLVKYEVWPHLLIRKCIQKEAFLYSGVRKIIQDLTWEIQIRDLPDIDYPALGYGSNKFKQLYRNYINEEELERVRSLLDRRAGQSFSSIAMSLRGQKKDSRSMGHCMQTLIISWTKDHANAEVQYRSTEVIQKFGADLIFLRYLLQELDFKPEVIRFRFANAYLSGVFFPTLCSFWDPVDFLDYLWENDKRLFAGGTRFFLRSAYREDQHFPYSPENLQHKFGWRNLDMRRIKRYLEEKHLAYDKPLPKIHHNKHEYVPRGQRS